MKKPRGKSGRKETASNEDAAVWNYTAATIEPLKRGKPRVHVSNQASDDAAAAKASLRRHAQEKPAVSNHKALHKTIYSAPAARTPNLPRAAPELAEFDRNSARKIRGGRIEIEARVDLHGLRQSEAHAALRSFLFRCQSRGLRFVLIITGKGKSAAADSPYRDFENERGVLKRNVPRWLEEPDVRSIVVSFTTAAVQHGGEGAIYVHLRTRTRG